jgi:hypothetical protein
MREVRKQAFDLELSSSLRFPDGAGPMKMPRITEKQISHRPRPVPNDLKALTERLKLQSNPTQETFVVDSVNGPWVS